MRPKIICYLETLQLSKHFNREGAFVGKQSHVFSSLMVPACQFCLILLLGSLLCLHQWKRQGESRDLPPEKSWPWNSGVIKSLLHLQPAQLEEVRLVHSPARDQPLVREQILRTNLRCCWGGFVFSLQHLCVESGSMKYRNREKTEKFSPPAGAS